VGASKANVLAAEAEVTTPDMFGSEHAAVLLLVSRGGTCVARNTPAVYKDAASSHAKTAVATTRIRSAAAMAWRAWRHGRIACNDLKKRKGDRRSANE
jgi:hypothetical protein